MNTINVTEEFTDNRRQVEHRTVGFVVYNYRSPTHWSSGGVCSVVVEHDWDGDIAVSLHWASGGVNKGFTDIEVADAMAQAFAMASKRMKQIEEASK